MPEHADTLPGCDCLAALLRRLESAPPALRLAILKQVAVAHGGSWDLPSDAPGIYDPVMPSIGVLGITAFAETVEELPMNWMRAARNALGGGEANR